MKGRGRHVGADRPDHSLCADGRYFLDGARKRQMRIPFQIARLEDDVPYGVTIGADEPPAVVIERQPELRIGVTAVEFPTGFSQ